MKNFGEFHDGSFEGLWIDGKTAHVFLATEGREQFTVVAEGVAALAVDGVKAGNILFDVLERGAEEILLQDIQTLYALQEGPAGETQGANLLEKARLQGWKILEVNPSYGASCLVLASSLNVLGREDWLERYVLNHTR
jgi:hypothetical protein